MIIRVLRICGSTVLLILAGTSLAGCTTMWGDLAGPLPLNALSSAAPPQSVSLSSSHASPHPSPDLSESAPPQPAPPQTVAVELRTGRKPQVVQIPFDPQMHVQDAIRQSRAHRKFRRMLISVIRTGPNGERQKLDCQFDPLTRKVPPQYDYALQPGDYLVIAPDPTSGFEKALENLTGSWSRLTLSRN